MGTLLGFVVGYVMGARAGPAGLEALVASARGIAATPEVRGIIAGGCRLVAGIVRSGVGELGEGSSPAAFRRAA